MGRVVMVAAATCALMVPAIAFGQEEVSDNAEPVAVEKEEPKNLPQPPIPKANPQSWIQSADYPIAALREQREGRMEYRLDVNENGRATNCVVTTSSGSEDLDQKACLLLLRRARFWPALDFLGNPTRGTTGGPVVWRIGGPERPPAPGPFMEGFIAVIAPDGSVRTCEPIKEGEDPSPDTVIDWCDRVGKALFQPIVDEEGNPVERLIRYTNRIEVEDKPVVQEGETTED